MCPTSDNLSPQETTKRRYSWCWRKFLLLIIPVIDSNSRMTKLKSGVWGDAV
jgi:hypothetical protein